VFADLGSDFVLDVLICAFVAVDFSSHKYLLHRVPKTRISPLYLFNEPVEPDLDFSEIFAFPALIRKSHSSVFQDIILDLLMPLKLLDVLCELSVYDLMLGGWELFYEELEAVPETGVDGRVDLCPAVVVQHDVVLAAVSYDVLAKADCEPHDLPAEL